MSRKYIENISLSLSFPQIDDRQPIGLNYFKERQP